ncbi:UDP-galactopyranose mutase [Escherichia coli]
MNIHLIGVKGDEPYYPINDNKNNDLYQKYVLLSQQEDKVIFWRALRNV